MDGWRVDGVDCGGLRVGSREVEGARRGGCLGMVV